MSMVQMSIDGMAVSVCEGTSVLQVAIDNGIFIPHLCYLEQEKAPFGACRLCFVEVEGRDDPVCACELHASDGLAVRTDGKRARALSRAAFELVLAQHRIACSTCARRADGGGCASKRIARYLGMPLRAEWHVEGREGLSVSLGKTLVAVEYDKCVLCGRCVRLCADLGRNVLGFAQRGPRAHIVADGKRTEMCTACRVCEQACPMGAVAVPGTWGDGNGMGKEVMP